MGFTLWVLLLAFWISTSCTSFQSGTRLPSTDEFAITKLSAPSSLNCGLKPASYQSVRDMFSKVEVGPGGDPMALQYTIEAGRCVRGLLSYFQPPVGAHLQVNFTAGASAEEQTLVMSFPYFDRGLHESISIVIHEWAHLYFNEVILPGVSEYFSNLDPGRMDAKSRLFAHHVRGPLASIRRPYHELFADLVTVMIFNDPRIANQANRSPGHQRRFDVDHPISSNRENGTHDFFDPVRSQLWRYVVNLRGPQEASEFVWEVSYVLNQEIQNRTENLEVNLPREEAIRRLTAALDARFSARKHLFK